MIAGFRNILIGVIVFVSVNTLLGSTIMTGTDVGTVLLKALLGLIVAFGVLVGAFTMFGKSK